MIVTRFAPSPTGLLHLGHAYAAQFAFCAASEAGGRFLLRIEDIDAGRCKPLFAENLMEDLRWLGLSWEEPVRRQSDHFADYKYALACLESMGLLYPCFCTRREVAAELAASGYAPHDSEVDEPVYPGTCRRLSLEERARRVEARHPAALRLDMASASAMAGPLVWRDRGRGDVAANPEAFGDIVLARRETPTSYHLSVTVDDHAQGVSLVTRGEDLFRATDVHRLLQALLGYDVPTYHHHALLKDPTTGRRYAKRDQSFTLRALRATGKTPEDVWGMMGGYLENV